MRNYTAYEIYDRRTGDQIDERTLDEAIRNHINSAGDFAIVLDNSQKIDYLIENGFIVTPMPFITTGEHQSGRAGEKLNPYEEHVQVDFNYPDKTINFDLHMEEHNAKRYLFVEFFPNDGIATLMFDEEGNEKVFEACPHCEEEVILDAREKVKQACPGCGNMIKPCSLCVDDKDCKNCG